MLFYILIKIHGHSFFKPSFTNEEVKVSAELLNIPVHSRLSVSHFDFTNGNLPAVYI